MAAPPRIGSPHPPSDGFALPLAVATSLLLVLASLASQSVLHQARHRNAAALGQRQLEDGLASAAQRLVGQVVSRHPCLLRLPLEHWAEAGAACADPTEQQALREGQIPTLAYRLLAWQPASAAAGSAPRRVHLELAHRAEGGTPAWRAAFALDLLPDSQGVEGLRELGLRGVQP